VLISLALLAASPVTQSPVEPTVTECAYDRNAMLALDVVSFDQTEGMGWRVLHDRECFLEAAEILRDWQQINGSALSPDDPRDRSLLRILAWHEGQMWGFAGHNAEALGHFEGSYRTGDDASTAAWNLYVEGTIAFLRRDRTSLTEAIAKLSTIPKPPYWDNAVGMDGKPISLPWPQNLTVLEGLERCWDEPYKRAFLCRDIPRLR